MYLEDPSVRALLATWPLPTLAVAVLAWAVASRPWRRLEKESVQHVWLGALLLLTLLWMTRATVGQGIEVQLTGAALAVTLFGLPLALVSLAIVNLASLLGGAYLSGQAWQDIGWIALAPRYVWMAAVPCFATAGLQALVRRWLPRHLFVFILAQGYFAALLAAIAAGAMRTAWLFAVGATDGSLTVGDALTGVVIIAFGEAFLTGMLVAIFVVYRPHWVATFDARA